MNQYLTADQIDWLHIYNKSYPEYKLDIEIDSCSSGCYACLIGTTENYKKHEIERVYVKYNTKGFEASIYFAIKDLFSVLNKKDKQVDKIAVLIREKGSNIYCRGFYFGPGCWAIEGKPIKEEDVVGWIPIPINTAQEEEEYDL